MTLLITVCHMTDLELVVVVVAATASKAEVPSDVPDGLEGRSCHKAVFGPEREEHELRVGCGILDC